MPKPNMKGTVGVGVGSKSVICYKTWMTFGSEMCSILTFIMVAIIFFTALTIGLQISVSVNKMEFLIGELNIYLGKLISLIKEETVKIKDFIAKQDILATAGTKASAIKQTSINTASSLREHEKVPPKRYQ